MREEREQQTDYLRKEVCVKQQACVAGGRHRGRVQREKSPTTTTVEVHRRTSRASNGALY